MQIGDYLLKYPNAQVWRAKPHPGVIAEGMLQFNEESAGSLGGPFPGNYAYYRVTDYRQVSYVSLQSEEYHRTQYRLSQHRFPRNVYGTPAKDENHLQIRLKILTPKDRKEWQRRIDSYKPDQPTYENPIALYIAGNDDSTWTKFLPTTAEADLQLALLYAYQPLDFKEAIHDNDFVFTN